MKKLIFAFALSLVVLSLLSPTTSALQDPYSVYGHIYDSDGNPASGAVVTIQNVRTGDTLTTSTDSNGYYQENLLNMDSAYKNGDSIVVAATLNGEAGESTGSVDTDDPGSIVDVAMVVTSGGPGPQSFTVRIHTVDKDTNIGVKTTIVISGKGTYTSTSNGWLNVTLSSGSYTVTASASGYETESTTISVTGSKTVTLQLEKTEAAAEVTPTEEVTILGLPLSSFVILMFIVVGIVALVAFAGRK